MSIVNRYHDSTRFNEQESGIAGSCTFSTEQTTRIRDVTYQSENRLSITGRSPRNCRGRSCAVVDKRHSQEKHLPEELRGIYRPPLETTGRGCEIHSGLFAVLRVSTDVDGPHAVGRSFVRSFRLLV